MKYSGWIVAVAAAIGLIASVTGGSVAARDVAVVIANLDYSGRNDPNRSARAVLRLGDPLREAGFAFTGLRDTNAGAMANALASGLAQAGPGDRVVVMLTGIMVQSNKDTYLLAEEKSSLNRFNLGRYGVSLDEIAQALSEFPGDALLLVGADRRPIVLGTAERFGARLMGDVPAGVTVVQAGSADLTAGLERLVSGADRTIEAAFDGALIYGHKRGGVPFTDVERVRVPVPRPPADFPDTGPDSDEIAFWKVTQDIGTLDAYLAYVALYPRGAYAADANAQIRDLRANPTRQAEAVERQLNLAREDRRAVQRDLAVLGFNPRGVDGIFGRGSRAALSAWQRSRGFDDTGFLTGNQINALSRQADERSAQLKAEEEKRRREEQRADIVYWEATGRRGGEPELRAYLERYPDGQFSEVANNRLAAIEAEQRAQAEAAERAAWDEARRADTVRAYRRFLESNPNGSFAEAAQSRLRELQETNQNAEQAARDRGEEGEVLANPITRLLVERRLKQLGLGSGAINGEFSDETRRGIRRFQRSRNITPTGYVNQQTLVALLAARGG